jgi:hypothetical protein
MRSSSQGYAAVPALAGRGGAPMTHQQRLDDRMAQNIGWVAPLPDIQAASMIAGRAEGHGAPPLPPQKIEAPRQRVEWDTRSSINNRFWESVQVSGPTAVTSAMLADHPTKGAWDQRPAVTRHDDRTWTAGADTPYFANTAGPGQRPTLPSSSVWANPHFDGWNPESTDTARELRGIVKEDRRFRGDDASLRVGARAFDHQWRPPVSVEQLAAAERLRPAQAESTAPTPGATASFDVGGQF